MQRRTFINKASFGFLLFGHSGFIPGLSNKQNNSHSSAQEIISAGDFQPVSILEYDPHIDRIISKIAGSLIKSGYVPDKSGYLLSSNRKQILSVFSIASASEGKNLPVAIVLERTGKSWKLVHSIDSFEIQARSNAVKDFINQPNPAINVENIVCLPKISNSLGIQKGNPYFVCKTIIEENSAKTNASIVLNEKSIWTKVFRTDF